MTLMTGDSVSVLCSCQGQVRCLLSNCVVIDAFTMPCQVFSVGDCKDADCYALFQLACMSAASKGYLSIPLDFLLIL